MPKVRILVNNIENLLSKLNMYTKVYGWSKIDIEYYWKPGQRYVCKETRHLAKYYMKRKLPNTDNFGGTHNAYTIGNVGGGNAKCKHQLL